MSIELNPSQFQSNPLQYKLDLGRGHSVRHEVALDEHERNMNHGLFQGKKMAGVDSPEPGYFDQPSVKWRQQALPGMEMSVNDHLEALGKHTDTKAEIFTGGGEHQLSLTPHDQKNPWETGSYLIWNARRGQNPVRTTLNGKHLPGEVQMVKSTQRGDAAAMFDTAEKLAHEHGYTFPKHSESRMPEGVRWSQAMMRRRGERVW